jgi:enamine deaminase RidA (YjgF/YER057c/UK114 family)
MHEQVSRRLGEAGLVLPEVPAAVGAYVPAVRTGNLVFTSGQLPMVDGQPLALGRLGESVSIEDGRRSAEQCALRALAAAGSVADLDGVVRVVKVVGYVASAIDFDAQPAVIDGASRVLGLAFAEAGAHAREAVGVAALPMGVPVELSLVLEVG